MKLMTLSLKTKMTIGACLVVAGITAVLAFFSLSYFQQQLRESISAQQYVLVSSIAGNIDENLVDTQKELVKMAKTLPLECLTDADRAQRYLDDRGGIETSFDNSIVLFSPEGTLIAETPFVPDRRGKSFAFRDYFKTTMATGKPLISQPFPSAKQHRHPVVAFTAPLFGPAGEVAGVLLGSVDLTAPNFLGKLSQVTIGKSGYLYLYNTDRTMIMHPDKTRILKQDVPPGVNKGFDKAVAGFEGTVETVNSEGLLSLASFKRLTATNWILAANFPQAEAYAAIDRARRYMAAALLAAIALSMGIVWFYMKHLTAPLLRFTGQVRSISGKRGAERLFTSDSGDEIGVLAEAFNGMVRELDEEREALRESEERLRQIAEHCREVFFLISSDLSRMIYINPAYETLWQQSCQSLYERPRSFTDIIHEEDRSRVLTGLEQLTLEEIYDQTYRIVRSDLTVRWIHARSYPVRAENGEVYRRVGIAEDVTKQKLAEEQVRKMQQAVEQCPVSIVITDREGAIEYVNPMFSRLTGYSRQELVGKNPRILKSGETPAGIYRQLWETITAGGEWRGEILNKKKTGDFFWESSNISPIKNPAGEITHYLGVKEDITARKRLEEELKKARNAAEDYAQRLEVTLEGSNDATWEWDMVTDQACLNTRYYEMTGYTRGEVNTNRDFFLKTIHPDDVSDVEKQVTAHIEGKSGTYAAQYRMVTKSGQIRHVMDRGKVVMRDDDGRPTKMAGVVTDVTEMKRLSDEVNRIHNLESIGLLAGGLAHDFNNVLNIIYGNVTFARMLADGNTAIVGPLMDAEEACERAKEFGIRLQVFSQGSTPVKEPIALPAIIEDAAGTLFKGSNIMHTIATAEDLLPVAADQRQIGQVIDNLLTNTKEAMADGGTVKIGIDNYIVDGKGGIPLGSGPYVRIALQDDGKGIPEEDLPRIFDPYFSTKDTYSQRGLGLGLTTCHAILKRHGGHIFVDSRVGIGTRITIYLPASLEEVNMNVADVHPAARHNQDVPSP